MNSLYGKFGMGSVYENHVIVHVNKVDDMLDKLNISSMIQLDNQKVLLSYTDDAKVERQMLENYSTTNISIAIASAITAYARIHMTQFKNNPDYNLFYSDTDSIVIDKPLPEYQVDSKLIGYMKHENTLLEGTFIAPKCYGGIFSDGTSFTKVKRFKDHVDYPQLKSLLNKDVTSIKLSQEKWYRSFEKGDITIKNQLYSLQATQSKRRLVFSGNKLVKTIPFIINNDKEII